MSPTDQDLRIRYIDMSTNELVDLYNGSRLTKQARSIIKKVLKQRGYNVNFGRKYFWGWDRRREIKYYEDIWADYYNYTEIPFRPNNLEFWIPIFDDLFNDEQPKNLWRLVFMEFNAISNEEYIIENKHDISRQLKKRYRIAYNMQDWNSPFDNFM